MNKEYIQTTPDTIMVTDTKGHIEEREVISSDIERELVLENNLEYLNNIILDLKKYIDGDDKFNKDAYLSSIEIPLFASFATVAVGTLYNNNNLFLGGLCLGGAGMAIALLGTSINNIRYKNDIKNKKAAYEIVLEKAYEIKNNINKELSLLRGGSKQTEFYPNIPISILEDQDFIFNTEYTLNNIYDNNVHSRRLKKQVPIK